MVRSPHRLRQAPQRLRLRLPLRRQLPGNLIRELLRRQVGRGLDVVTGVEGQYPSLRRGAARCVRD